MTMILFGAAAVISVAVRMFVNYDRWRYRHLRSNVPWNWRALVGPGAYHAWRASHSEDQRG